jgi:FKBP-type peptidyl-prolyl cis-trans isomerase 2
MMMMMSLCVLATQHQLCLSIAAAAAMSLHSLGGLHEGLAVELANGSMAVVVEAGPEQVKLDANNMMAGKTLLFTLEVLSIDSSGNN